MANRLSKRPDIVTASPGMQQPSYQYWGLRKNEIVGSATITEHFTVDSAITTALFGPCNAAFETRPTELLVAALAYSFGQVFPERATPSIYSEGHGREAWDEEIDISRTVGWFTTIFPSLSSNVAGLNLIQIIQMVKDSWSQLADNG